MYKTLFDAGETEIIIEKSRFIASAIPIKSEAEAQHFIESLKKKHWQATHNVPVYVMGENYGVQRYSDDGEPSGTAGLPVLEMLKKEGITDICLVITRYFGGVKLGTGGLVRAYTESAKSVLTDLGLVVIDHYEQFTCQYDYTFQGKIAHTLTGFDTQGLETTYGADVTQTFFIPKHQAESVAQALIDLTSGQMLSLERELVYGGLHRGKFVSSGRIL